MQNHWTEINFTWWFQDRKTISHFGICSADLFELVGMISELMTLHPKTIKLHDERIIYEHSTDVKPQHLPPFYFWRSYSPPPFNYTGALNKWSVHYSMSSLHQLPLNGIDKSDNKPTCEGHHLSWIETIKVPRRKDKNSGQTRRVCFHERTVYYRQVRLFSYHCHGRVVHWICVKLPLLSAPVHARSNNFFWDSGLLDKNELVNN